MSMNISEKIKQLRKEKGISQKVLASNMGVSFQAVSKWEKGITMPDVSMIPALASFFGISTDELFDFNLYEIEKNVAEICDSACEYRYSEPEKAERILREGLKKYPGNEIIMNNLLYILKGQDRRDEVIALSKSLIDISKDDEVKYDACRILAEAYKEVNENLLVKETLLMIPELYFTKLQLKALLLDDDEAYFSAVDQKCQSISMAVEMALRLVDYLEKQGEKQKALSQLMLAEKLISLLQEDEIKEENAIYDINEFLKCIEEKKICLGM